MKALRKTRAAAGVELVDIEAPVARDDGEVLVRVHAAGICGSDLHVDDWTPSAAPAWRASRAMPSRSCRGP